MNLGLKHVLIIGLVILSLGLIVTFVSNYDNSESVCEDTCSQVGSVFYDTVHRDDELFCECTYTDEIEHIVLRAKE
jgi:hypothetical protein